MALSRTTMTTAPIIPYQPEAYADLTTIVSPRGISRYTPRFILDHFTHFGTGATTMEIQLTLPTTTTTMEARMGLRYHGTWTIIGNGTTDGSTKSTMQAQIQITTVRWATPRNGNS